MRAYELVMITRPELEEEAQVAIVDKFTSLIQNQGGTVEAVDKLGKRRLAYEIKGFHEGLYTVMSFKADQKVPRELDRVLKIADEVVRHMIVAKDE